MSHVSPRIPTAARALIAAVVIAGTTVVATQIPTAFSWSGRTGFQFLGLALVTAISEQFWVEIRHGSERENFSLTDAFFTASLLLFRPSVLLLGVVVGVAAGQAVRRVALPKLAFNVGQFVLSLGLAVLVYRSLHDGGALDARAWLAAGAGMAVYFVVNESAVAFVIALVRGVRFTAVVSGSLGISVTHWVGNVAFGTLIAVTWGGQPRALPLLAVPLVLTYLAYRGWLRSLDEGIRMGEMARAADAISTEGDLAQRIPEADQADAVAALAATLNRLLERLESAFERERQLIGELSHELRTPITICRGHLEVLTPGAPQVEVSETIELVIDELGRMGRIVDDMTTIARSDDPTFLHPVSVPVGYFISELAVKARPLVDGRLRLAPTPDDAVVSVDPHRLTQALLNMLQNAVVHGRGEGPIELNVECEPGWLRFEVADHGGGLPSGTEESVFQPFLRVDSSRPGRGLGLAIVRSIAEAHGGSAGVDNRPGDGATFWIRVPA